jgi:hypothetical protein
MSNLEKGIDRLDKGVNRLQIGCLLILSNLFFAGFCLWGVYAASISWRLETRGESTAGTVVRMDERDSSEGGCCVYVPVIEFNAGGQTYSFMGDTAAYPPEYETGQQVSVLYDPADPETAQIDDWFERWLFPLIIIPAMFLTALLLDFFMIQSWIRGESLGTE